MPTPVPFSPSMDAPQDEDELKVQQELIDTLLSISKTTFRDEHEALRAVHAKSHGLIKARFVVQDGLPPQYAQGVFSKPATYDAEIRLSSAPGDLLPDTVSTHHGLAIKVHGVEGPQLPGAEGDTQDFLLANGKAFNVASAKSFLANLKLLAKTTDKAEGLKVALSTALRAVESGLESVGGQSALMTALGGHPAYYILSEEFFSQTPYRYGGYVAKLGLYPATPEQNALKGKHLDLHTTVDAHRQSVRAFLSTSPAAWELRVQLCTDVETMPIEKPNVAWPEDESPYVTVARIEAAPQEAYADEMVASLNKAASFSPWHGLESHRPLGEINRLRKAIYEASARFRLERNGCPFHPAPPPAHPAAT